MSHARRLSRRRFLEATAAAAAAPAFVPAAALGKDGRPAPSNRVVMGCIGVGWQGGGNMGRFLGFQDCQVVAIADVDAQHRQSAVDRVNKHYKGSGCKGYPDFRELTARTDIDAVMCACPDHWHALTSLSALTQGKDVFGEKPISHKFVEGRAMADAQRKHGRIWQTGSWQRSVFNFRYGVELVHNGHIGKVKRVEIGLPSGHADFGRTGNNSPNSDPPAHLDYDFWIGPAQMEPYNRSRSHKNWRWNYNIGGGQLMDWIGHHCDIAHWGLSDTEFGIGPEAQLGPLTVEGSGEFPPKDAIWNTATKYRIECKYPEDVEVVIAGGHGDIRGGTKWIGDNGKWVYVNRGKFEASEKEWTKRKFDRGPKKAYLSENHWRNFLDCVKSRKPSITPAEFAHRSATPGHLGLIAMITGRKLKWDPKTETIANDSGASALLRRDLRKPWRLDQFS